MKTASFPSLRVEPELRDAAQSALREGETLSAFVESAIRERIERRNAQAGFLARGLRAAEEADRTGEYYTTAEVLDHLRAITEADQRQRKRARGARR